MKRNPTSIDGFVSRSPRRQIGRAGETSITPSGESNRPVVGVPHQELYSGAEVPARRAITREEIDSSLNSIDDVAPPRKAKATILTPAAAPEEADQADFATSCAARGTGWCIYRHQSFYRWR